MKAAESGTYPFQISVCGVFRVKIGQTSCYV